MKYSRIVSRLAGVSLIVILLALTGASMWIAILNQQAASVAASSTSRSSMFRQALYQIALEESVQFEYALRPSPFLREEHLQDSNTLIALLHRLQQDGDPDDADFTGRVLAEQSAYLIDAAQYFGAVDTGNLAWARTIHYQDIDPVFDHIQQQMLDQANSEQAEATQDQASFAQIQHITLLIMPIMFAFGLFFTLISGWITGMYRKKIDQAVQTEMKRLEHLALTDPLTGLGNHHAFQERLSQALQEPRRGGNVLLLALLDLDGFKIFNDEQGHQLGDDVLRLVAALLGDAHISPDLFRLGSDDFALIVSPAALIGTTLALERLRQNVEQHSLGVTISIGIAHTVSDELTRESLHAQAAAALQEAKRRGRNRLFSFDAIEGSISLVSSTKIQALRRLLSEGKLTIAFQPIWTLATSSVLAFEALARPAAEYGFAGPQEMFDIAEHIGQAHELDAVCVKAILVRAADLPANALLFLNLTPQTLVHDLLTGATLLEAVTSAGLQPSRVVLEITERSIVQIEEIVQKVKYLRLMGFRVALDDAGAGNAGLEMLSQLSVDFVKIDRAVVSRAVNDLAAYSVLVGIITIARESQITVIAEGIENPEMLDLVQRLHVHCVQGYLLGRPSETIPDASTLQSLSPLRFSGSLRISEIANKTEPQELANPLYDLYT